MPDPNKPLSWSEILGTSPLQKTVSEALRGLKGDPYAPAHAYDFSSLRILQPIAALKTWFGWTRRDKLAPIYNFFNHIDDPNQVAHSVRSTYARDFRGKRQTYDSHKATDFIVPVGTAVCTPAPGKVVRIAREFDRGGLHVCIDHGQGFFSTSSHLARALVSVGDRVERGDVVALSGAAGLDFVMLFPWNVPHIHFNVWLNGIAVDPFARAEFDEVALWRTGNWPVPHQPQVQAPETPYRPTVWKEDAVEFCLEQCVDPQLKAHIASVEDHEYRAAELLFQMNYRPTRFKTRISLYQQEFPRRPYLDLPLRAKDFRGVIYDA